MRTVRTRVPVITTADRKTGTEPESTGRWASKGPTASVFHDAVLRLEERIGPSQCPQTRIW